MKISKKILPVFLLLICFASGLTLAYMSDSQKTVNRFDMTSGEVKIEEPGYDGETPEDRIMKPGMSAVKDPSVRNTGEVPLYVFLKVAVPVRNVRIVTNRVNISEKSPKELFSYDVNGGWIQVEEKSSEGSYASRVYAYAMGPVEPGDATCALFDTVKYLNILEGELDPDDEILMTVTAYGIQSDNLELSGTTESLRAAEAYAIWKAGAA